MQEILVVDDEIGIRELLSEILSDEGYKITLAQNASEARNSRNDARPDMVLLDIWMPDTDGITLLKEWASNGQLTMPVVMMSGHGTIDTATEALKHGAQAFLEKPITLQKLLRAVEQALARAVPKAPPTPGLSPVAGNGIFRAEPGLTVEAAMTGGMGLPVMQVDLGPQAEQSFDLDRPLREARDAFEKSYFEFHLAKEGGSMTRVAEKTGLERTHLYRKLKQLGIKLSRRADE